MAEPLESKAKHQEAIKKAIQKDEFNYRASYLPATRVEVDAWDIDNHTVITINDNGYTEPKKVLSRSSSDEEVDSACYKTLEEFLAENTVEFEGSLLRKGCSAIRDAKGHLTIISPIETP